jgi:hypothetical protein
LLFFIPEEHRKRGPTEEGVLIIQSNWRIIAYQVIYHLRETVIAVRAIDQIPHIIG